jgi:hypothetical protein
MGTYTAVVIASNQVSQQAAEVAVTIEPACLARLNQSPTVYGSVQAAVDASAQAGDLVKVAGTCSGVRAHSGTVQTVYLDKELTVRGGYNADFSTWDPEAYPTTLDAREQGRVFYITGDIAPTLESLHVTNGWYDGGYPGGGGIYSRDAHLVISGCHIYSNTVTDPVSDVALGAGVALDYAYNAVVRGNDFYGNRAEYGGGALAARDAFELIVVGNEIHDNEAGGTGGGLYFSYGGPIRLRDNAIYRNTAGNQGGGLYSYIYEMEVGGNQIYDNQAVYAGGGLSLKRIKQATLEGNEIRSNLLVDGVGGGLHCYSETGGEVILVNNIVAGNQIVGLGGEAGLDFHNVGTLWAAHNTIAGNTGGRGQGMKLYGWTTLWMTDTILVGHTVGIETVGWVQAHLEGTLWGSGGWANGTDTFADQDSSIHTGSVNVHALPGFIDPGNGDYRILPDSAAVDAGVEAGVGSDIDGEYRPFGEAPDIGADEWASVERTVVPGSPATLSATFGGLTTEVQVPADAVDESTTLVYTALAEASAASPAGFGFAGLAFTLEAYQGGELQPGFAFGVPVNITIHYLNHHVAGLDEESLELTYWDEGTGAWQDAACGPYVRNLVGNWLSVPVCHLSEFALLGQKAFVYLPLVVK